MRESHVDYPRDMVSSVGYKENTEIKKQTSLP